VIGVRPPTDPIGSGATEMASFRAIRGQDLPRDSLVTLFAAEPFDFPPGEALIYNNSA
jgi:hypothetical protein